jgi:hypothetical protein
LGETQTIYAVSGFEKPWTGNKRGNSKNLKRGGRAKGKGKLADSVDPLLLNELLQAGLDRVADEVSRVLQRSGASRRHISRLAGRDLGLTIHRILGGSDVSVSTLLDLAHVTNHELVITFREKRAA